MRRVEVVARVRTSAWAAIAIDLPRGGHRRGGTRHRGHRDTRRRPSDRPPGNVGHDLPSTAGGDASQRLGTVTLRDTAVTLPALEWNARDPAFRETGPGTRRGPGPGRLL